jgi:tetratricopeptide (TPR) repeat protein
MAEKEKCFVVMPFGKKPKNDGTGAIYDFDKVYRVLIRRAIRNVDMMPLRADETEGNRVIHADMFKDLRDRHIVLVDLSLLNANVFYELGIRHVMSSTGTVLIANEETVKELPFDIALSRVIPYHYDGQNMDWEEVERVAPLLQAAIEEAKRGILDSPVYAFLETVTSPNARKKDDVSSDDGNKKSSDLDYYQKKFSEMWLMEQGGKNCTDAEFRQLIKNNNDSEFGVRALGYYGLNGEIDQPRVLELATLLTNFEQHDLAEKLFEKGEKLGNLEFDEILTYARAISCVRPDPSGAREGLKMVEKARDIAKKKLTENPNDSSAKKEISYATQHVAAMLAWIWNLTRDEGDLDKTLVELREAIRLIEELIENGEGVPLGRYAQNLLRYAMFLRILEQNPERIDVEKNFEKILALRVGPKEEKENYSSASYLRWYQVLVLADMGKYDDAQTRAMSSVREDIKYASKDENNEIGRSQYTELRRQIEQYSRYWKDTKSIARISQILKQFHFQ